ncbi:MAG: PAS domain-containing protein [Paracoccus sp. (in: a-proteobacteria)]|uniref:PAS domain-containing protein n=1 Tax=Paracoccus sp. TaxID=267 RepID=UPI0026DF99B3|nr:PAS domain-containing protein [Paracoccus sp. (in: a-proteobacteria)]MDO5621035.1 PAS domain-containing protein [Paracoccus sp. (in: a-proteobacteria)]
MTDDESGARPPSGKDSTAEPGHILHLADFDQANPARICAGVRAYWEGLRKGRAIPDRTDVQPAGIRGALDHAFILERIAPGAARFRLAGRHLVDLMGMEVRGMPLCALLNPSARGRLSDVLESMFKAPQIISLTLTAPADYARPALNGQMLLLPLRSDLGDVTRALGCLVTEGQIGRAPRRFDIAAEQITPLIPGAQVMAPTPSFARGFDEAATPWQPAMTQPDANLSRPAAPLPNDATPEERRARFRIISSD